MEKLDDLLLFTEVVEHAGFSAAARSLDIQRSKLSRHIADLENRMGIRLLHRNTRNVVLTPAGEQVYHHAVELRQAARNAFSVASDLSSTPQGILRIGCSSTLAQEAIVPILGLFMQEYPQIRVIIHVADSNIDLISSKVDLVFRITSKALEDSSLIVRPVCAIPMILVASKNYNNGKVQVEHPSELTAFNYITLGIHENYVLKDFVHKNGDVLNVQLEPYLSCGNMSVIKSAVKNGMGIAVLPHYLCIDELKDKEFIEVFSTHSHWSSPDSLMNALLPTRQNVLLVTKLFLDFAMPLLRNKLTRFDFDIESLNT
ncbi:LysR family transcriptional regulator [Acinetobacter vivianii]|uniref:LysR family transcriptional regulator n=1 Tax=Acinetobacter vivianii TaxID=1776742 RepID=UPI003D05EE48